MTTKKELSIPITERQKTRSTEMERLHLAHNMLLQVAFAIDNIIGTDDAVTQIYLASRAVRRSEKALVKSQIATFQVGERVSYLAHKQAIPEHGTVTRVTDSYVFVCFDYEKLSKACRSDTLVHVVD